ncbi:MAG: tetratricopeptide repeat protein [Caldilineaceae bacterium]
MNNDAIVDNARQKQRIQLIAEAFELHREYVQKGGISILAQSPLAIDARVQQCLLVGEPNTPEARGYAVQAMLYWAVDKLSPSGTRSLLDMQWRPYHILHARYLDKPVLTFTEIAETLKIEERTVYKSRLEAIENVAERIFAELELPEDLDGRQRFYIERRYAPLGLAEQRIVQIAAVYQRALARQSLQELAGKVKVANPEHAIRRLLGGLLMPGVQEDEVQIHPGARDYLMYCFGQDELTTANTIVAEFNEEQHNFLDASRQWRQVGEYELAANLLIDNFDNIVGKGQAAALRIALAEFAEHQLAGATWAHVKIAAGDATMFDLVADNKDKDRDERTIVSPTAVSKAASEYGLALSAQAATPDTQALALYRCALAYEAANLFDAAIAYYNRGIELLEGQTNPLLIDLYIDKAWIYLQEQPDPQVAAVLLNAAEAIIPSDESRRRSLFHTAKAKLCYLEGNPTQEIEHNFQAHIAAIESKESDLILLTAGNLGMAYVWDDQWDEGLKYLARAIELAQKLGIRSREGKAEKTTGAAYFFKKEYDAAIRHYMTAYNIFTELGNENWLGEVCHDLAEAYAEKGEFEPAYTYFQQGKTIAEKMQATRLLNDLNSLTKRYPPLTEKRTPRQQRIDAQKQRGLDYATKHGSITPKEYMAINKLGSRAASRHLGQLVDEGRLISEGKGPNRRYIPTR